MKDKFKSKFKDSSLKDYSLLKDYYLYTKEDVEDNWSLTLFLVMFLALFLIILITLISIS